MSELREKEKIFPGILGKIGQILTPNILIIIILSFTIFIIALYYKLEISTWIQSYIGPFDYPSFTFVYTNPEEVTKTWYFEVYQDASYYYVEYLDAFIDWWNPYGRYKNTPLDYYLYGPMFIYGLYFTYLLISLALPGASREFLVNNTVKFTALNFDCLSAVMIYLIISNFSSFKYSKIKKHLYGLIGAFAYIFMPMNLLYVDSYYLNIPQMTFFTLLTVFLFMKKKYRLAAYSLSIAWLTKQMPLFILIPLFSYIWKTYDIKKAFKEFLRPFLVSFLIFSIPWIFITPLLYIGRIFAAGRPLYYGVNLTDTARGVTFAHTFLYIGSEGLAKFYYWINIAMVPFIITYAFVLFVGHFNAKKIGNNDSIFIYYITLIFVVVHTFISRGIFKYYDAFINPFLILSSILLVDNLTKKIHINFNKKNSLSKDPWIKSSRINKEQILVLMLNISLIVILTCIIYGFNWLIMITIRFVHPVFLLSLTILLSLLMPSSYYKEVFKKESYTQLGKDFKEFFKYIGESIVRLYKRIENLVRRKKIIKEKDKYKDL